MLQDNCLVQLEPATKAFDSIALASCKFVTQCYPRACCILKHKYCGGLQGSCLRLHLGSAAADASAHTSSLMQGMECNISSLVLLQAG